MRGLQLIATGGAKPGRVVTNEELSHQVDTSDAWITTRTGIRQRRYCTDEEDAATLAIAAARQALARSALPRRILPAALLPPSPPPLPRRAWHAVYRRRCTCRKTARPLM